MRRRDERNRVLGPHWCESMGYWRVVVLTPSAPSPKERRITRHYLEKDEADEAAAKARRLIERNNNLTVGESTEMYKQHLKDSGTGEVSYRETTRRLKLFLADGERPLSRITPERAKEYYDAFRERKRPDGKAISVDYHRAALINVRSFFSWAVGEGLVTLNPFASVKGIGRRNAGKLQHTGNETRKLYAFCLEQAQAGDRAALGVLMALLMALRSSDITRRVVRDVDLDGTVLRVHDGKTAKSNRPRRVPAPLQPLLRELVAGRQPFEPLFKTTLTKSGHHTRRWLEEAMVRFCERAGVPYVCPHALKGTAATLLAETGAAAETIADHLSHEKVSTSRRHYIAPGAVEQGQAERAFAVISGGRR